MDSTLRRTWAEIDLDALAHNYRALRARMGEQSRFLGVVKADAYGHGAVEVSRTLEELGAEYLAVSNLDEALELRQGGVSLPILQLGLTPADQTAQAIACRVTQAVWSESAALAFSREAQRAGGTLKIHIKLDTGMSRLGFPCDGGSFDASLEAIRRVCALPGLEAEGIFTHFAVSDEADEGSRAYTLRQYRQFTAMTESLAGKGLAFVIRHCANSGAAAGYPQFACDMFRPGIVSYGIGHQAEDLGLRPVMTLKTVVGAVRELPERGPAGSASCPLGTPTGSTGRCLTGGRFGRPGGPRLSWGASAWTCAWQTSPACPRSGRAARWRSTESITPSTTPPGWRGPSPMS